MPEFPNPEHEKQKAAEQAAKDAPGIEESLKGGRRKQENEDVLAELKNQTEALNKLASAVQSLAGGSVASGRAIESKLSEMKVSHDAQVKILQGILDRQAKQETFWSDIQGRFKGK